MHLRRRGNVYHICRHTAISENVDARSDSTRVGRSALNRLDERPIWLHFRVAARCARNAFFSAIRSLASIAIRRRTKSQIKGSWHSRLSRHEIQRPTLRGFCAGFVGSCEFLCRAPHSHAGRLRSAQTRCGRCQRWAPAVAAFPTIEAAPRQQSAWTRCRCPQRKRSCCSALLEAGPPLGAGIFWRLLRCRRGVDLDFCIRIESARQCRHGPRTLCFCKRRRLGSFWQIPKSILRAFPALVGCRRGHSGEARSRV